LHVTVADSFIPSRQEAFVVVVVPLLSSADAFVVDFNSKSIDLKENRKNAVRLAIENIVKAQS
jgi:hypothetical protein